MPISVLSEVEQGHAVVTGSSSGIGRAVAERLLALGWRVTGIDRAETGPTHPAYTHLCLDLGDLSAIRTQLGALAADALVHAAGFMRVGRLADLDPQDGALMWTLHVQAATALTQALVPHMQRQGRGRVVYLGSRVSQGFPGRGQYAAVKAALVGMARSWAMELAPDGVTVNVVSPAATDTAMTRDPARAASQPVLPPIGRLITAGEIADLVAYLLSPSAAALTGQEITLCGGASLPH